MRLFGYEITVRKAASSREAVPPLARQPRLDLSSEQFLAELFDERGEPGVRLSRAGFYVWPRQGDLVTVVDWIMDQVPAQQRSAVAQLYGEALTLKSIEANVKNRELVRLRKLMEVNDG